ncbi:MAG: flippase-like domain-containing protein [Bdellovibrionota bacterium]
MSSQTKPPKRSRIRLRMLLGPAISITCLVWLARSVEQGEIFHRVSNVRPAFLVLAVLFTMASYALRAWRWPFFFDRNAPEFWVSFRCLILGFFMNNVLPARIGELVRAHIGGTATGRSRSSVLATIAGERLADGLMISVLFATLFSFQHSDHLSNRGQALSYVAFLFAAAAVGTLVVLSQRDRVFAILERIARIMPGHVSTYTLVRLRRFVDGLEPMFRPGPALKIAGASILIWFIELAVYGFVVQAFNSHLSLGGLAVFLAAVNFSSLIPAAPAGVGVIEAVASQALEELGIDRATALAMVSTQHLIQIAVVGLPGALYFFRMGGKIPDQTAEATLEDEGLAPPPSFADVSEPRPEHADGPVPEWADEAGSESQVELTVVIPAYNEETRLPKTLLATYEYLHSRGMSYEIVVVDDGSTDDTAKVVTQFEHLTPSVRLLTYPKNRGKGYAVRFGMLNARGRLVLFDDADGATPIEEIERLEAAISSGAHIAIGSRAMFSVETGVQTLWYRKLIGRVFNAFVNLVVLPGVADTQCGFKLFVRPAAKFLFSRQKAEGFSFDVEVLFLARKAGFKIAEVPVNWTNIPGSKVNLMKDSLLMARDIVRFRLRGLFGGYGSLDTADLKLADHHRTQATS